MEDLRLVFQVHGKLNLHRTFDLLLCHDKELLNNLRQGESLEFQLRSKRDDTRSVRIAGIDDAHVLTVIGRSDHLEALELPAVMNRNTLEVDGIVNRGLEFLRTQRQSQHRLLRLPHSEIDGRGLQHVLRVFGTKAQHLFAVHNHLA